jgi:hypothetical protein
MPAILKNPVSGAEPPPQLGVFSMAEFRVEPSSLLNRQFPDNETSGGQRCVSSGILFQDDQAWSSFAVDFRSSTSKSSAKNIKYLLFFANNTTSVASARS